jgi:type IV secretion system protein VirB9
MTRPFLALAFVSLCAGAASAADRPTWAPGVPQQDGIRTERSSADTVIPLALKLRYTTMVFLPEHEDILLDDCGDRDFWIITVNHHMVSIKPAKPGGDTNLNLITKTGTVYSFLLKEGGKGTPDLKVFITRPEDQAPPVRKFYTVAEYEAGLAQLEALKGQVTELRATLATARQEADARAADVKQQAPARFHFDYKPVKDEKPFHVKAVFHDGTFTYIQTTATEKFTIYETKDGKPSLVQFQVENGTYIIPKVIDDAYLAIGTARFPIALKSGAGN